MNNATKKRVGFPPGKSKRLTPIDKRFAVEYIKSGNATSAMAKVKPHITHGSAQQLGHRLLNRPAVQQYMLEIMDKSGLTDQQLANDLNSIVNAGTSDTALKEAKPADALRGIEMAYRLRDRFPAQKTQLDKREISIQLESKSPEELQDMLAKVASEAQSFTKLLKTKEGKEEEGLNSEVNLSDTLI